MLHTPRPTLSKRWWQHPALVITTLIIFPPAGIALAWASRWNRSVKIVATVLSGLWFLLILTSDPEPKPTDTAKPQAATPSPSASPPASPGKPPSYIGKTLKVAKTAASENGYATTSHDASDGDAGQWDTDNWHVCFQTVIDGKRPTIDFGVVRTEQRCPARDGQPIPWPTMPNVTGKTFDQAQTIVRKTGVETITATSAYTDVTVPADHGTWLVCFQNPEAGESIQHPKNATATLALVETGTGCPSEQYTELHPDADQASPDTPDNSSRPVKSPGAFCSPAGSVAVSSTGKPLVCGPASDGRNRWQS
jgi:hypothetical protein